MRPKSVQEKRPQIYSEPQDNRTLFASTILPAVYVLPVVSVSLIILPL